MNYLCYYLLVRLSVFRYCLCTAGPRSQFRLVNQQNCYNCRKGGLPRVVLRWLTRGSTTIEVKLFGTKF